MEDLKLVDSHTRACVTWSSAIHCFVFVFYVSWCVSYLLFIKESHHNSALIVADCTLIGVTIMLSNWLLCLGVGYNGSVNKERLVYGVGALAVSPVVIAITQISNGFNSGVCFYLLLNIFVGVAVLKYLYHTSELIKCASSVKALTSILVIENVNNSEFTKNIDNWSEKLTGVIVVVDEFNKKGISAALFYSVFKFCCDNNHFKNSSFADSILEVSQLLYLLKGKSKS